MEESGAIYWVDTNNRRAGFGMEEIRNLFWDILMFRCLLDRTMKILRRQLDLYIWGKVLVWRTIIGSYHY